MAVGSTWLNQDQPNTGTVPSGDRQLGRTMVVYPGHPLVGRIVTVVRRYGRRERGQWIVELPDGSRQYVPTSWCAPLSSEGPSPVSASSQDDPPLHDGVPSPLSLAVLRDLAAEVRRLQEEAAQRREEQQNAGGTPSEQAQQEPTTERGERSDDAECDARVAEVGELPCRGSAPTGAHDPASGTPAGGGEAGEHPVEEVRRPWPLRW